LAFARTPFSSIKKLSYVLFLGFLVTLIKILPTTEEQLLYGELNILGFFEGLLYTARFLISMAFSLVIFETTSRLQILDALEQIENTFAKIIPPIKKLHLAYIISVTICFIPEIFTSWNKISLAVKAKTPQKTSIKNKAINLYSRLMALFYAMFEYAENSRKAISNRINIQS
jgi:energy-coupling factor transporter transmembrane protein EcfT